MDKIELQMKPQDKEVDHTLIEKQQIRIRQSKIRARAFREKRLVCIRMTIVYKRSPRGKQLIKHGNKMHYYYRKPKLTPQGEIDYDRLMREIPVSKNFRY